MKNHLLDTILLYKGTLNSSLLRVREIFQEAVRRKAAAIIVAHNQPSGAPTPSPEDIRVTREYNRLIAVTKASSSQSVANCFW
jgi:DNA repair protein RadC